MSARSPLSIAALRAHILKAGDVGRWLLDQWSNAEE
jgi:hypothetical protein